MTIIQPVLGILSFTLLALLFSTNRKAIDLRIIVVGLLLQVLLGVFILRTDLGPLLFSGLSAAFDLLFRVVGDGASFVFGDLTKNVPFAFHVLPTVIFFSALMRVLYDIGLMGKVVGAIGAVLRKALRVSGAESLAVAANIFVGQTEAPLMVRPYVERMTRSELMAVMTGGLATVAGSVMAAYIAMLSDTIPDIAGHLMSASLMSAPAALVFAKILVPETEEAAGTDSTACETNKERNLLFSLSEGTKDGLYLAFNIGAMLIVFIATVSLINAVLFFSGNTLGAAIGINLEGVSSLQAILGYLFAPLAWLSGVPASECLTAGMFLGEKTVLNEFVAYANLASFLGGEIPAGYESAGAIGPYTQIILSYALCGFANFASIGILIGGIGGIAPTRVRDIAELGIRALFAATLACLSTAAIAGALISL